MKDLDFITKGRNKISNMSFLCSVVHKRYHILTGKTIQITDCEMISYKMCFWVKFNVGTYAETREYLSLNDISVILHCIRFLCGENDYSFKCWQQAEAEALEIEMQKGRDD